MDHRRLVLPDDARITSTIGKGAPTKRALNARLRRAERSGLLPSRIYLSAQRYAYDEEELVAALERLPRSYTATLSRREAA